MGDPVAFVLLLRVRQRAVCAGAGDYDARGSARRPRRLHEPERLRPRHRLRPGFQRQRLDRHCGRLRSPTRLPLARLAGSRRQPARPRVGQDRARKRSDDAGERRAGSGGIGAGVAVGGVFV